LDANADVQLTATHVAWIMDVNGRY